MFQVTSTKTMQAVSTGHETRAAAHEAAEAYERLMGLDYIVEEVPQFTPGDIVTSKSGVFYCVINTRPDGATLAAVPVRGGAQRLLKVANVALQTEEDLKRVTAPGFQEALEATVTQVKRNALTSTERREIALREAQAEDAAKREATIKGLTAGDVVEATTRSTHPRTVRVILDRAPWLNPHGHAVLHGEGGPVVVDVYSIRKSDPTIK